MTKTYRNIAGSLKNKIDSPPEDVVLGITHLRINGELVRLYKCPFCLFKNIHEDEITHHIRYKDNAEHDVDVDKLDKTLYNIPVVKKQSRYTYVKKEDLPLPSIRCIWCPYEDKVVRDLEWHFLEKHKDRLYQMKLRGYSHIHPYYTMEYRAEKAANLAKRKCGIV